MRKKQVYGFATGDIVCATVPKGKYRGTHTGRVAVRASGNFAITTAVGRVDGISWKYLRLIQKNDGYGYFFNAIPLRPEGRGLLARSR